MANRKPKPNHPRHNKLGPPPPLESSNQIGNIGNSFSAQSSAPTFNPPITPTSNPTNPTQSISNLHSGMKRSSNTAEMPLHVDNKRQKISSSNSKREMDASSNDDDDDDEEKDDTKTNINESENNLLIQKQPNDDHDAKTDNSDEQQPMKTKKCIVCGIKWWIGNIEWFSLYKICSECPSHSLRILCDKGCEDWTCPLCIHSAHKLFSSPLDTTNATMCKMCNDREIDPIEGSTANQLLLCCLFCKDGWHETACQIRNSYDENDEQTKKFRKYLQINALRQKNQRMFVFYKLNKNDSVKYFYFVFNRI